MGRAYALKVKAASTGDTSWGEDKLQDFLKALPILYVSTETTGIFKTTGVDRADPTTLIRGWQLYVLGDKPTDDGWLEVISYKARGFVRAADLASSKPPSQAALQPTPATTASGSGSNAVR